MILLAYVFMTQLRNANYTTHKLLGMGNGLMDIRLNVVGVDTNVQVIPALGRARMTVLLDGGLRRDLDFPLSVLDQLAVSLLDVVERARHLSTQQGYAHDFKPEEMTTSFPTTSGYRLLSLPKSNEVGVQVRVPGIGVIGFAMTPKQSVDLGRQLSEQLENLHAALRPPS